MRPQGLHRDFKRPEPLAQNEQRIVCHKLAQNLPPHLVRANECQLMRDLQGTGCSPRQTCIGECRCEWEITSSMVLFFRFGNFLGEYKTNLFRHFGYVFDCRSTRVFLLK